MAAHSSQTDAGAPAQSALASVVDRNIASLTERRRHDRASAGLQDRTADLITRFTGSMSFVYLHLVILILWISVNLQLLPFIRPFDRNFILLATATSVEAIFLSTFIPISQNRMAENDRDRADLDLQISLLSDHEVTRLVSLVSAIADHLGLEHDVDRRELQELKRDVAPEAVLERIEEVKRS